MTFFGSNLQVSFIKSYLSIIFSPSLSTPFHGLMDILRLPTFIVHRSTTLSSVINSDNLRSREGAPNVLNP